MNKNNDVPKHSLVLAYLKLAIEQMEQMNMYKDIEIKDHKNGVLINNPCNEFYNTIKNHIENTECFIRMNYAGKFCLKCGIIVENVLYCDKCDKILQGREHKPIKIQKDFRNMNLGVKE